MVGALLSTLGKPDYNGGAAVVREQRTHWGVDELSQKHSMCVEICVMDAFVCYVRMFEEKTQHENQCLNKCARVRDTLRA